MADTPLEWNIAVAGTSPSGEVLLYEADASLREKLAGALDIEAVDSLVFKGKLSRYRKSGLRIAGTLSCNAVQACVVSLEPVPETLSLEIDRRFLPQRDLIRENERMEAGELLIDPDDALEVDELEGGGVDLWEILLEEITLALDPFPRHRVHGAAFQASNEPVEPETETIQPFSTLKTLISEKKSKK